METIGPIETEREALGLPAVRAIFDAADRDPRDAALRHHAHAMLISACVSAGVELGGYDRRILLWLAGFEPQACAVVAGLIGRAHDAGSER